jgi:aldehyde dehydrogenase (NAD+)
VCISGKWIECPNTDTVDSFSPATGEKLSTITQIDRKTYDQMLEESHEAFKKWRMVPAPKRGELVRDIGQALRENKQELGELVSLEMGKILTEGLGEVQEAIDIADYAVGLSRQLYGVTTHSERAKHRMYEQWHPLGTIGIITAFNFPVAVWAWNAMIAAVCGDTMIWKPSSKVPLCAIATHKVVQPVLEAHGCPGIMNLAVGKGSTFGSWMLKDRRLPLISATGSCRMGRKVGAEVGARLGRHILELGGNNAMIISPSANFENALRAVCFGAIGTAGQRCTSTRRVFLHEDIYDNMLKKLKTAYESVKIGNPLDTSTLVGPLIDKGACEQYLDAVKKAKEQGGRLVTGGELHTDGDCANGCYVKPTLIEATMDMPIVLEETFAPILYVFKYKNIEDAINMQNNVDQGLSSAIFTNDLLESERFLSHEGSDCGIANVNIGTSGAEIGLAFGGEKDTGGGREAGSDSWKQYMRRQANTINFGTELPLAQGVKFDI